MKLFPVFEVLHPGPLSMFQDAGRPGWKRYGVPPGGALDQYSLTKANLLLDNDPTAPVLEVMMGPLRLRVLCDVRIALTGAIPFGQIQSWRTYDLRDGDEFFLPPASSGLWYYLAVPGGWHTPSWFGSSSVLLRAGLGQALLKGDVLHASGLKPLTAPSWKGTSFLATEDRRDFTSPPPLEVWPGPQRDWFDDAAWELFLNSEWSVHPRSDRSGYRLAGPTILSPTRSLRSEPVRTGSVQVPPNGQPIVLMRDGPATGGYPKLALLSPAALDWLAQCGPGIRFRFKISDFTIPEVGL